MNLQALVRLVALGCYLCLVLPAMWLAILFRLVHWAFRLVGVPNRWLPLDVISYLFARGVLVLTGMEPEILGRERVPLDATIFMPNHSSGLDPFLLTGTSPVNAVFVFKRELMYLFPPVFLLGRFYGHIPISRSKRDSAINSLSKAAKKIAKYRRSVCIFPEGTRSQDGALLPLKSGPFYMAAEAGVPVTPVYIKGAFELMSKGQMVPSRPGRVVVEYLAPIPWCADHEELKRAVDQSLHRAAERWTNRAPKKGGGYGIGWCAVPVAAFVLVALKLKTLLM